jgi:tRNA-guanine family transglycosylase
LGLRLASLHNITYYMLLMKTIREKINEGEFSKWSVNYLNKYSYDQRM